MKHNTSNEFSQNDLEMVIRLLLGICVVLGLAIYFNVGFLRQEWPFLKRYLNSEEVQEDFITRYEKRFCALRGSLPMNEVVGYISSKDLSDDDYHVHYYLTQYALSPVILDYLSLHRLVVGNFPDTDTADLDEIAKGLFPIEDYGNGVVLFRTCPVMSQ